MPPVAPTASSLKRSLALRAHKNSLFAAYYIDTTASTNATYTLVTQEIIPESLASGVDSGRVHTARFSAEYAGSAQLEHGCSIEELPGLQSGEGSVETSPVKVGEMVPKVRGASR
jgi:hypothetical protein